jgi:cell division protein FtsX
MTSTTYVDWPLLGQVVLVSILAGVGIVVAFSLLLVGLSVVRDVAKKKYLRVASAVLTVVTLGVIVWALVEGLLLILNKS